MLLKLINLKYIYPNKIALFWLCCFFCLTTISQKVQPLQSLGQLKNKEYIKNKTQALYLAKKHKWPVKLNMKNNQQAELVGLLANQLPKYFVNFSNVTAAITVGTNKLWPGGISGFDLSGATSYLNKKLAVFDEARVRTTHKEFFNRVIQKDNPANFSNHATHVMGVMMAKGIDERAKGMSYNLDTGLAYDWNNDLSEIALGAAGETGFIISNHSYGTVTGWNYNNSWYFFAPNNYYLDPGFGYYDDDAKTFDEVMFNAPYYLLVKAAGNNRGSTGPEDGESFYGYNESGNFVLKTRTPQYQSNDSFKTLPYSSNAKNILTVGAVDDINNGYFGPEDVRIAYFSSWGPTRDGRIKPDIVGNGIGLYSPISTTDNSYATYSGTSQASPNVAGSLLLLQELYRRFYPNFMWNSSLKGIAIHTASEAGNFLGPDYVFGWGLLNSYKAAQLINEAASKNNSPTSSHLIIQNELKQNQTIVDSFISSGKDLVTLTLCWTDPPGFVGNYLNYQDTTKELVNDLDLVLWDENGNQFFPWNLNAKSPKSPAYTGINSLDNVEKIETFLTKPGLTYKYKITYKNNLQNNSQKYSLIISGVGGSKHCQSSSKDSNQSQIDSLLINGNSLYIAKKLTYEDYRDSLIDFNYYTQNNKLVVKLKNNPSIKPYLSIYLDLNNSGSFTPNELVYQSNNFNNQNQLIANFKLPQGISINNYQLLRIILQDTNSPSFNPCGLYNSGQTLDFNSFYSQPKSNLQLTNINNPNLKSNLCPSNQNYVDITVLNKGIYTIDNFKSYWFLYANNELIDSNEELNDIPVKPNNNITVNFQKKINFIAGNQYTLKVFLSNETDENPTDDTLTQVFTISIPKTIVTDSFLASGCSGNYELSPIIIQPNISYIWSVDKPDNIFSSLTKAQYFSSTANPNFYVTTGADKNYGAKNQGLSATGNYQNQDTGGGGNYIKYYAGIPLELVSGKMFTRYPGKIRIIVADNLTSSGGGGYFYNQIDEKIIDVKSSSPNPSPYYTSIDNQDSGRYYNLNIKFPKTGFYYLIFLTEDGATLFRNNNVNSFPLPQGNGNIFNLTDNSAQSSSYYYYLYDLRVQSLNSCPTNTVPLNIQKFPSPVIHFNDDTLLSSVTGNLTWYYNGSIVSNKDYYIPLRSGTYKVTKQYNESCIEFSEDFNFTFVPKPYNTKAEIGFKLYPTVTNDYIYLEFKIITAPDFAYQIYSIAGQKIYESNLINLRKQKISLPNLQNGIYFFRFRANGRYFTEKIVIVK